MALLFHYFKMLSIIGERAKIIDMRKKCSIYVDLRKIKDTVSYRSPRKFKIGVWQKETSTDRSWFEANKPVTSREAASAIED